MDPSDMCLGADAFRNSGSSSHPIHTNLLLAWFTNNAIILINPAVTKLIEGD